MRKSVIFGFALACLMLTGCEDYNLDLGNIDTTTRINVNNLTLPVKIDEISLSNIIDADSDDGICIIDGNYTYVKKGDFSSANISVDPFAVDTKEIAPVNTNLVLPQLPTTIPAMQVPLVVDPGQSSVSVYDFIANNISHDIHSVERLGCDFTFTVGVSLSHVEGQVSKTTFNNFMLQLPTNLSVSKIDDDCVYDPATGHLVVNRTTTASSMVINMIVDAIDFDEDNFDAINHSVHVNGKVGLLGGGITINTIDGASLPSQLQLTATFTLPKSISISTFSGKLSYDLGNISVPAISLSNLPDLLNQPGTDLVIDNPQLYISIKNPLWLCGLHAQSGFDIIAWRESGSSVYSIDNGTFTIAANAVDNFCFSPKVPDSYDSNYPNAVHVPYSALSRVLSGDGVPERLDVELTKPNIPLQAVTNFSLGSNYGDIAGNYTLRAPLNLSVGSLIKYSDKLDGWGKDISDITVERLSVRFKINTDIPAALDFKAYPIDSKGHRLEGATLTCTPIPAFASDHDVEVVLSGSITGIDGIEFEAVATSAGGATLSSDMYIRLSNIRAQATGYYETKL